VSGMTEVIQRARVAIREHGWVVQGVSDHGCQCCEQVGRAPRQTGRDPYLYTAGLTDAGLPELLLRLTGRNTNEWMDTGTRMLNRIGRHSLHGGLVAGQFIRIREGISVTIAEPPPFSRETIWPGLAYELYGKHRVRVVEVLPTW